MEYGSQDYFQSRGLCLVTNDPQPDLQPDGGDEPRRIVDRRPAAQVSHGRSSGKKPQTKHDRNTTGVSTSAEQSTTDVRTDDV